MNRSYAYVILAAVGFSFILVFSTVLRNTGMSSFEQLFLRLGFGSAILFVVMRVRSRLHLVKRRDVPFFMAVGCTYALFGLSGLSAIAFGTPIPVSVALVYTQPIFTAVISQVTGKEKVSGGKTVVVLFGVVGAFLVSGIQAATPQITPGIVFPVLAGLFYAIYLWLKRQSPYGYAPYQTLFYTFVFSIPFLLLFWIVFRNFSENLLFVGFVLPDCWQLFLLFIFALFSTVLPYGLLNYVRVDEVSPTTEGLLLLGDPLLHTLWAALIFEQFISEIQYLGATLILVSAALNLKLGAKATKHRTLKPKVVRAI